MDYRERLSDRSPLRVLEHSIRGGLGPGNLGVVCAGAGVGKTAFLVDVALDELARGRQVLHVGMDQPLERIRNYYDEIFVELARSEHVERAGEVWLQMEQGLRIQAYQGRTFSVEALDRTVSLLEDQTGMKPDLMVLDGYDWTQGSEEEVRGVKAIARAHRAEVWMSAAVKQALALPPGYPEPMPRYEAVIDVLLHLEGDGGTVHLRLLKDHDNPVPKPVALDLNPTTLLLVRV